MDEKCFLLVTANENETNALLNNRNFIKDIVNVPISHSDSLFYNTGRFGKYKVVHFELTQQGSARVGSSLPSILTAIDDCHPCAVILVGVAFGKDSEKHKGRSQHIGDVLISTHVADYESGKIKKGVLQSDGVIAECGMNLIRIFKDHSKSWRHKIGGDFAKCIPGLVLSGDKVIDDRKFKQKLFDAYPRAIGGEMEGRGAYAACQIKRTELIIVKGICDWADGTKSVNKNQRQVTAAKSAVSLLKHVFSNAAAFDNLPGFKSDTENLTQLDSAARYRLPDCRDRYHYSCRSAKFSGRNEEIKRLKTFCGYGKMRPLSPKTFSWWLVSGEGGSGKSRLCFEFANTMRENGWSVCFPPDNSETTLNECSENLPNNTLFVLDYSEFDMETIAPWMLRLYRRDHKTRIRVLLIQRNGELVEAKIGEYTGGRELTDSLYSKDPLRILPLDKRALLTIINNYVFKTRHEGLSRQNANVIYEKLKSIDEKLLRPLFIQILADAYFDDPEKMNHRNREDALDYICAKEEKEIRDAIEEAFKDRKTIDFQDMQEYGIRILCMATMIGGMDMGPEFEQLMPEEAGFFMGREIIRKRFFSLPQLFAVDNGNAYCPALKPDIIGEYFVIKYLKYAQRLVGGAWYKPQHMKRFVVRLFQDYKDLLSSEQLSLLNNVKIPDGVTQIEDNVFQGFWNLENIILPDSVKSIGVNAFADCGSLARITLPDSVDSIGFRAFNNCRNLIVITLSKSLKAIGESVFQECGSLAGITLPDSVESIGPRAFYNCRSLTWVTLPRNLKTIESSAFDGCGSLADIALPDSIETIGSSAFAGCSSLTDIILPKSLKTIGVSLFQDCSSLTDITLPRKLRSIKASAFERCVRLTDIEFPDSIESIDANAFSDCMNLTGITLPGSIKSVENYAFARCISLTAVIFPKKLRSIEASAFRDCIRLIKIAPDSIESIGEYAFSGCRSLTDIALPKNLNAIGKYAFSNCTGLTGITLPESITYIGESSFEGCSSLADVYIRGKSTPVIKKAFDGLNVKFHELGQQE